MSAGDVVVRTHVIMPKGWTRILDDLHITLSITPTEAMAGFNRTVKLPDGRTASITTSELTPPGTTITMRGYGTPKMIRADGTSPYSRSRRHESPAIDGPDRSYAETHGNLVASIHVAWGRLKEFSRSQR